MEYSVLCRIPAGFQDSFAKATHFFCQPLKTVYEMQTRSDVINKENLELCLILSKSKSQTLVLLLVVNLSHSKCQNLGAGKDKKKKRLKVYLEPIITEVLPTSLSLFPQLIPFLQFTLDPVLFPRIPSPTKKKEKTKQKQ